jgi:hypothetical protein
MHVRRLSRKLSQHLSKTADACENFWREFAVYFGDLPRVADVGSAVKGTFAELQKLKKTLEFCADRCSEFARDVSSYHQSTACGTGLPKDSR